MKAMVLQAQWDPKPGVKLSDYEQETRKVYSSNNVWRYPKLKIEELPKPTIGPKELLIRVRACGVCGTDVHFAETDEDGYMKYSSLARFPIAIGHEFAGVVEEVAPEVKNFREGDLVASESMLYCGECINCKNGFPNHCMYLDLPGVTVNGGFAEWITVEARHCWKINDLVPVYGSEEKACEAGAVCEPTCIGYIALFVRGGGFLPGSYIVVYGAGPIGLAAITLARQAGASKVIAFEIKEDRMKLAKEMGADYVFNPRQLEKEGSSPHEKVLDITGGAGADIHIEATGIPAKVIPEMQASMAINGKMIQIGKAIGTTPVYLEGLQIKRAQLLASEGNVSRGIWQNVIRLMAAKKIDMTGIVTNRYPLERAIDAVQESTEGKGGKIIVTP